MPIEVRELIIRATTGVKKSEKNKTEEVKCHPLSEASAIAKQMEEAKKRSEER